MAPHGSDVNGLNWDDGHIPCHKLSTVVKEAVSGFAHVYIVDVTKCRFISELLELPIFELENFKCPPPNSLKPQLSCTMPCHRFPDISCESKNAHTIG